MLTLRAIYTGDRKLLENGICKISSRQNAQFSLNLQIDKEFAQLF